MGLIDLENDLRIEDRIALGIVPGFNPMNDPRIVPEIDLYNVLGAGIELEAIDLDRSQSQA